MLPGTVHAQAGDFLARASPRQPEVGDPPRFPATPEELLCPMSIARAGGKTGLVFPKMVLADIREIAWATCNDSPRWVADNPPPFTPNAEIAMAVRRRGGGVAAGLRAGRSRASRPGGKSSECLRSKTPRGWAGRSGAFPGGTDAALHVRQDA